MTVYNFRITGTMNCETPDDGVDTLKIVLMNNISCHNLRVEVGDDKELVIEP